MEKLTFEDIPQAIGLILEKIQHIEKILENRNVEEPPLERMLTVQEAALFLKVTVSTLYTKVCRGEVPAYKPGRRLFFDKEELVKWISTKKLKTNVQLAEEAREFIKSKKRPAMRRR
jgi:excisionase family DNA binding protein